jgi:cytochrome P450
VPNNGLIRFRVLLNKENVLVTSPEALKEILVARSDDFKQPHLGQVLLRNGLGDGLLAVDGEIHKRQRKALTPAFSFRHIKDLYPVFWKKGCQVVDAIAATSAGAGSTVQNIMPWASRVTLDVIGLACIGQDFDTVRNPEAEINQIYHRMAAAEPPFLLWDQIGFTPPIEYLFYLPLPAMKLVRSAAKKM